MAKTVIKKRKGGARTGAPAEEAAAPESVPTAATVPAAAVPATALPPFEKAPKYGPFAILMLIATLCFVGLVIVQYVEWRYYHQPPTAFLSTQGMGAPAP